MKKKKLQIHDYADAVGLDDGSQADPALAVMSALSGLAAGRLLRTSAHAVAATEASSAAAETTVATTIRRRAMCRAGDKNSGRRYRRRGVGCRGDARYCSEGIFPSRAGTLPVRLLRLRFR